MEGPRRRDDAGIALIASMLIVLLVSVLGVVAVSESINSQYVAAGASNHLDATAAGRSGLDSAIANIESQLGSGTLTCPSTTTINSAQAGGAVNSASVQSFNLAYEVFPSAPTVAQLASLASGLAGTTCSSSPTIQTAAQFSAESSPWYLAMASQGQTTSHAQSWSGKYSYAVVQFSQATTPEFTDAMYGGVEVNTGGNMNITGTGAVYDGGGIDCANTNNYYSGDLWALGGVTSGSCQVHGNLYVSGNINMSNGTAPDITGGVYSTGSVAVSGGFEIEGDIVANGDLDFANSGTNLGNIYVAGTDSTTNAALGGNNDCWPSRRTSLSTSVCLDSFPGTGPMDVYSANGTIDNKSGEARGTIHNNTAWPGCPVPAGSGITCTGSALNPLPRQQFPSLTYGAWWSDPTGSTVSWDGQTWTYINDTADSCSTGTGSYASGTPAKAIYQDVSTATSPTLIGTDCAFWWNDFGAKLSGITLHTNVAIFDPAGFNFDNTVGTWVTGSGSPMPHLYLVVPCSSTCASGSLPQSSGAQSEGTGCSATSSLPTTGDIWFQTHFVNVDTFFYTPDNFCSGSSNGVTGQVYVGGYIDLPGGFTITADPSVSQQITTGGGSWSSSVQQIQ